MSRKERHRAAMTMAAYLWHEQVNLNDSLLCYRRLRKNFAAEIRTIHCLKEAVRIARFWRDETRRRAS